MAQKWFAYELKSSASAEPNAVTEMAIYLGNRGYAGSKIAIITDHLALVAASAAFDRRRGLLW